MTFKIIIQQLPISAEFEVGSLSEAVGILQQEESEIRKLGEIAHDLNGGNAGQGEATPPVPTPQGQTAPAPDKPKRGRPAKDAQAPAPIPVPPAAPADMTSADGGIPPGLRRDPATNTAPAMVAPPPLPPAPPAPPPSGVLAGKIIANLDARKAGSADGGKGLVDWLASGGLVVAGSPYDEAVAALRLMPDDKLATIAGLLQVA